MNQLRVSILIFCLVSWLSNGNSQTIDKFYKWDVSVSYALQEHDKRLFDYPQIPRQNILEKQPEQWGTHWYKVTLNRNVLESKKFKLKAGLGYSTEYRTFTRPYDHCLWAEDESKCYDIGTWTNGYKIKSISVPLEYSYNLFAGLNLNGTVEGNFRFYKHPDTRERIFIDHGLYNFQIYSIAIFPGISYDFGKFILKADYRAYQLKNIDDVIIFDSLFLHGTTPDPREDGLFESYNPAHFRLTLSYEFGERQFETE